MTPDHNVNVNFNQPPPQRKLGCLGFLGVLLVIGAILAQPVILGTATAVVAVIALIVWATTRHAANGTTPDQERGDNDSTSS